MGKKICDGCNVNPPHKHRCFGEGVCECDMCNNPKPPTEDEIWAWLSRYHHVHDDLIETLPEVLEDYVRWRKLLMKEA